jgi:hypothetical protein
MSTCPQCDQPGIFGYRDKNTGEMTWYCTTHRLDQYWADARGDHPVLQAQFATSMRQRPNLSLELRVTAAPVCRRLKSMLADGIL